MAGDAASAVVLSSGKTWIVVNHAGQLQMYAGTLEGTTTAYAGNAKQYISGSTAVPAAVSLSAAVNTTALSGTLTLAGQPQSFSFSNDARYTTPALLSDLTGTWVGSKGAGSVVITWSVSAAGALTGSSSSGCSYTGTVAVHSVPVPVGVFDLGLSETCTNLGASTTKDFAGIVMLDTAKTAANFAFTTSSGTDEGDVQATKKQ